MSRKLIILAKYKRPKITQFKPYKLNTHHKMQKFSISSQISHILWHKLASKRHLHILQNLARCLSLKYFLTLSRSSIRTIQISKLPFRQLSLKLHLLRYIGPKKLLTSLTTQIRRYKMMVLFQMMSLKSNVYPVTQASKSSCPLNTNCAETSSRLSFCRPTTSGPIG